MKLPWTKSPPQQTFSVSIVPAPKAPRKRVQHQFDGAVTNTVYERWLTSDASLNSDLKGGLSTLRARARDLMKNDDYCRRYLNLLQKNVVGQGVQLQARIQDANGKLDATNNKLVEDAWWEFTRKGNTTADGRYSFREVEELVLNAVPTEGEIFIRKHNKDGEFCLELISADAVDVNYDAELKNGNRVCLGIEVDKWNKPVAYHVRVKEGNAETRKAIPADQIIHVVRPEQVSQQRGYPWIVSAMRTLHTLKLYREAELIASTVGASKMGFFTSETGEEFTGMADGQEEDGGALITNADGGTFHQLPPGMSFESFDPQHPNAAYASFVQEQLRGLSAGLGISYPSLANDANAMSWSALRHVELQDRDFYRTLQTWLIESLHVPVFEAWLKHALLANDFKKNIPEAAFNKFNNVQFMPRSWQWVDPMKDVQANKEMVLLGVKSLTQVAAEQGFDLEEVTKTRQKEKAMRDQAGFEDVTEQEKSTPVPYDNGADEEEVTDKNGRPN